MRLRMNQLGIEICRLSSLSGLNLLLILTINNTPNRQRRRGVDAKDITLSPIDSTRARCVINRTITTSKTRALRTLMCGSKTLIVWCIIVCSLDLQNQICYKSRIKIRGIGVTNLLPTITIANRDIRLICTAHLSKNKVHPQCRSRLNRRDLIRSLMLYGNNQWK